MTTMRTPGRRSSGRPLKYAGELPALCPQRGHLAAYEAMVVQAGRHAGRRGHGSPGSGGPDGQLASADSWLSAATDWRARTAGDDGRMAGQAARLARALAPVVRRLREQGRTERGQGRTGLMGVRGGRWTAGTCRTWSWPT
jgi:hypothetical protein